MTPGNGDACVPQRPVKALPTPEAPRHATALLCFPNHGKAVLFRLQIVLHYVENWVIKIQHKCISIM